MAQLTTSNAFQQLLLRYILDYHPYMQEDRQDMIDFIVMRAENAKKADSEAFDAGLSPLECEHAARQALYAGLHFSPITYLIEVGVDNYGYEMEKEEAVEVYRNPEVREIFEKYGDDIEGDPKEHLLVEELVPYLKHLEGRKNFIYSWQKPENDEN